MPFFQNLADITEYNTAYYWALSALERGILITKYQNPWFVGSWWRNNNTNFGPNTDANQLELWRITQTGNGLRRIVNSRTQSIPTAGQWNIDYLLADTDSDDYNKMDYHQTIKIPLSIDTTNTANTFYTDDNDPLQSFNGNEILWIIRLSPKVYSGFGSYPDGLLCDINQFKCDINQDTLYNEKIVNRTIKGNFLSGTTFIPYTILPTTSLNYYENPMTVNTLRDNNIRESSINETMQNGYQPNIQFSATTTPSKFNPDLTNPISILAQHNILAEQTESIKTKDFIDIIQNSTNPELQLLLVSPLISSTENIYPFLEYKLNFDSEVADRFYNIQWIGKINEYQVTISVQKPTTSTTIVWDFTIIF